MVSGLQAKFNKLSAKEKQKMLLAFFLIFVLVLVVIFQICKAFNIGAKATPLSPETARAIQAIEKGEFGKPGDPVVAAPTDGSAPPLVGGNVAQDANDIYSQTVELQTGKPVSAGLDTTKVPVVSESESPAVSKRQGDRGKMVLISVSDSGRSNPFLPAYENVVPSSLPKFNFNAPPETVMSNSDAAKVMGTTISGILYDKYSPSAIINIAGTDYLVKKGDVINSYRVLAISKEQVVVQLGHNVYKAGVGQILSQGAVNYNTISNLNKKFGGNDVAVSVKKRSYK